MAQIHYGWKHNPKGVEAWLNAEENRHPVFGCARGAQSLIAGDDKSTVVLTEYVTAVEPGYVRGVQGIGDCVSWGFEFACSVIMAIQKIKQRRKWRGRAATEAIYGGSRVEALGKTRGGYSDGSYGAAAVKWLQGWGVLTRQDYSEQTGNPDHDLSEYSSKRAKSWGNFGCGGRDDTSLDDVARQHPVKTGSLVTTFEEAAAAIGNGYPVPVCSNTGFERKTRDADGFLKPFGSWAHCMCFAGKRWGKRPGLLCVNSHYPYVKGPRFPGNLHDGIAGSSWWVDAEVCNQMLGRWKDSFALSQFVGFKKQSLPDLGFTFG